MSLLREIQHAATNSDISLAELLRKCKILGTRLNHLPFKNWVNYELNGYPDQDSLPTYRILKVDSKGNFVGPLQAQATNIPIPLASIPEKYHKHITHSFVIQTVAELEHLANQENTREPWDTTLTALVGKSIVQYMTCIQAWKEIPTNSIIGILDIIRTKILDFALEIEQEAPDAGEALTGTLPVPQDKVTHIFNNNFYGNIQNNAIGSTDFKQNATIKNGEGSETIKELLIELKALNNPEVNEKVLPTVQKMQDTCGTKGFKEHYTNFMSIFADHMQVLGPVVTPYLPLLAQFI